MKYTVEQLSRILSVAAVGELASAAFVAGMQRACIEQAAHATWTYSRYEDPDGVLNYTRYREWDSAATGYRPSGPVPVLRWLEGKGFA